MMPAGLSWYRVLFPLLTALLILPVWIVELVPLTDLPLHMARSYVYHSFDSDPSFAAYLQIAPHLRHNSAIELILNPLLSVMSLERATQCFLSLYLLLFAAGCHWLGRALHGGGRGFGSPHPPMLACLFISYHGMFLYGYVNFAAGLAMAVAVLALRVAWANIWNPWRLAPLAALCVVTYLFHLAAVAILGFAWAIWTLHEVISRKRLVFWDLAAFAAFLPAAALYLFWARDASRGATSWSPLPQKALHLLAVFSSPSGIVTIVTSVLCLGALAAALWFFRRTLLQPVYFAGVAFFLLFLASPNEFHNATDADVRFLPIALLLLTASIPSSLAAGGRFPALLRNTRTTDSLRSGKMGEFPNSVAAGGVEESVPGWGPRPAFALLLALVLGAFLFRHAVIAASWRQAGEEMTQAAASLDVIERDALLYNIVWLDLDPAINKSTRHFIHLAALAVPRRHVRYAPFSTFPAGTWMIGSRTDFLHHTVLPGQHFDILNWNQLHADKTYFWTYGLTAQALDELRPHTRIVYESGPVRIFRVLERPSQP